MHIDLKVEEHKTYNPIFIAKVTAGTAVVTILAPLENLSVTAADALY